MVEHLSDWHDFRPLDPRTYPKVNAPVQVRYVDGKCKEGMADSFFAKVDPTSSITGWRYIKLSPR
jgi:hypothetical protein